MPRHRIVWGNGSLADYIDGGGHWTVRIQYLLGLKDLGHDVFLLALLWSTGNPKIDEERIRSFFERLEEYGLKENSAILLFNKDSKEQHLESASAYGKSLQKIKEIIQSADCLWNDCCHIRQPLLGLFERRVLLDLDPGHLQVSALTVEMDIFEHDTFLSVGKNLNSADCEVPKLGVNWNTFTPFIYLPLWQVNPDPGKDAPFSSVTHWTWAELWYRERVLSISKRDAYLKYIELPKLSGRSFQLAANIHPKDETGDRELLISHGWELIDPWDVARSPNRYRDYISSSRAEIMCPKPIFRELNTGWISDRSVCYLASGRPVLAEDTCFSSYIPTGRGLLTFKNMQEAVEGVREIDCNYKAHMNAARELAEEFFDSKKCLNSMLEVCG